MCGERNSLESPQPTQVDDTAQPLSARCLREVARVDAVLLLEVALRTHRVDQVESRVDTPWGRLERFGIQHVTAGDLGGRTDAARQALGAATRQRTGSSRNSNSCLRRPPT